MEQVDHPQTIFLLHYCYTLTCKHKDATGPGESRQSLTTCLLNIFVKVSQFEQQLRSASLVCLDGNLPVSTIDYVCSVASKHNVNGKRPLGENVGFLGCRRVSEVFNTVWSLCATVWYEPTDADKACKPFLSDAWKSLTYCSPNLVELCTMTRTLGIPTPDGKFLPQSFCLILELKHFI